MRKSIVDLRDTVRLAKLVHEQMNRIDSLEEGVGRNTWLLAEVCSHFNIAVCDYCSNEWFTCNPVMGPGPRGDVRGLLVAGGACCTKCLDTLYEKTVDFKNYEFDECCRDIAGWLMRHRDVANMTLWSKESRVKYHMKHFLP